MKIIFLTLLLPTVAHAGAREGPIARLPLLDKQFLAAFHSAPEHTWPVVLQFLRTNNHDAAAYESLDSAFQRRWPLAAPISALEYAPALREFAFGVHSGDPHIIFKAQEKLHELSTHIKELIPGWQIVSSYNEALQAPTSEHERILLASAQRMAAAWQTDQVADEIPMPLFSFYSHPKSPHDGLRAYRSRTSASAEFFRVRYVPWYLAPNDPFLKILGTSAFEYGLKHIRGVQSSADHYDIELMGAPGDANRYDDGPTLRIIRTDGRIKILPSRSSVISETPAKPQRFRSAWLQRLYELTDWSSLEFGKSSWP